MDNAQNGYSSVDNTGKIKKIHLYPLKCSNIYFFPGEIKDAIEHLEKWLEMKHRWQFTVPFSHKAMEEFTKAVKDMKNPDLWDR